MIKMKVKHLLLIILVLLIVAFLGFAYLFYREQQDNLKFQSVAVNQENKIIYYGPQEDPFSWPVGIAVHKGQIYIADANRHRIRIFTPEWRLVKNIGHYGKKKGELGYPVGIAVNSEGEIFVSEVVNNRIQVFSPEGAFKSFFPQRKVDIKSPTAIAIDKSDNVLVFDRGDHFIKVFDRTGKLLFKFGGPGSSPGQLKFAMGIAVLPNGNICVSDSGNRRIQFFDKQGKFLAQFAGGTDGLNGFALPRGIAAINNEKVAVVDALARRVLEISRKKDAWESKILGKDFVVPDGAFYADGRLYVADRGDNSVAVIGRVR
ncbi:NHL repeat containing protein [Thermincola ferriacetica]|uniref:NHL repeat containing protein n=2 Tax=Thermincola ferriacetica TaxID=281456 RepID=A0A0L6W199_9FIRM|nr:NHL repeat containing protein [Thermincola ferriacetica]